MGVEIRCDNALTVMKYLSFNLSSSFILVSWAELSPDDLMISAMSFSSLAFASVNCCSLSSRSLSFLSISEQNKGC